MTIVEALNWFGMALCVTAFFVKNVFYLRLMSAIGCACVLSYYTTIMLLPAIIGNVIVLVANSYYLTKMYKSREIHKNMTRIKALVRKGRIGITLKRSDPQKLEE